VGDDELAALIEQMEEEIRLLPSDGGGGGGSSWRRDDGLSDAEVMKYAAGGGGDGGGGDESPEGGKSTGLEDDFKALAARGKSGGSSSSSSSSSSTSLMLSPLAYEELVIRSNRPNLLIWELLLPGGAPPDQAMIQEVLKEAREMAKKGDRLGDGGDDNDDDDDDQGGGSSSGSKPMRSSSDKEGKASKETAGDNLDPVEVKYNSIMASVMGLVGDAVGKGKEGEEVDSDDEDVGDIIRQAREEAALENKLEGQLQKHQPT